MTHKEKQVDPLAAQIQSIAETPPTQQAYSNNSKESEQAFLDQCAIAAMQGLSVQHGFKNSSGESIAKDAYDFAYAMSAERTRRIAETKGE